MAKKFRKPQPLKGGKTPPPAPAAKSSTPPPQTDPNAPPSGASGLQASPDPAASGQDSSDPVIAQVQDKVRQSIPPQFRVAVQKLVLAGQKIMYDPKTHHLMVQALQSDSDPAHAVGMGVTQLMTMMWVQSKGSIPPPALIPAAILLVCEALDFCEQSKLLKPDNDMVGNAVQVVVSYMMQKMGIKPSDMAKAAGIQGEQPANTQTPGAPASPQTAQQMAQQQPPATGGGGLIGAQMGGANGGA
jgi:hypothetical protein